VLKHFKLEQGSNAYRSNFNNSYASRHLINLISYASDEPISYDRVSFHVCPHMIYEVGTISLQIRCRRLARIVVGIDLCQRQPWAPRRRPYLLSAQTNLPSAQASHRHSSLCWRLSRRHITNGCLAILDWIFFSNFLIFLNLSHGSFLTLTTLNIRSTSQSVIHPHTTPTPARLTCLFLSVEPCW
jgi:hypothetical protein